MDEFENVLTFMTGIACTVVFIFFGWLIYNFCTLQEFKHCYDINFQKTSCQKYLNY